MKVYELKVKDYCVQVWKIPKVGPEETSQSPKQEYLRCRDYILSTAEFCFSLPLSYHLLFLYSQKDDDIEEGDLPEHRRTSPSIDFSKVDPSKPEELLKMSKKGKTVMVFATVSGNPTEKETEEITSLWQGSLFNANFDIQRYFVRYMWQV